MSILIRYNFFLITSTKDYRFLIFVKKINMSQFHKLTIQNIIRETEKAVSIAFTIPENLKDEFTLKAGQYITLKTNIDGALVIEPKFFLDSRGSFCEAWNLKKLKDLCFLDLNFGI